MNYNKLSMATTVPLDKKDNYEKLFASCNKKDEKLAKESPPPTLSLAILI